MEFKHVNTGCLYEADGQKITLAYDKENDRVHFIDHSRNVDGTVYGAFRTPIQVIGKYVKGEYLHCELSIAERFAIERDFYPDKVEFKDISAQYKINVLFGW